MLRKQVLFFILFEIVFLARVVISEYNVEIVSSAGIGDNCVCTCGAKTLPKNCLEILRNGNNLSNVYTIQPSDTSGSFKVRCNMDTRGGGWTYVLNRYDGTQDFYLYWQDYKNGFGNLNGEFWLGLQHLYDLTGGNQLLVELLDPNDNSEFYAIYDNFEIGNEDEGYKIKVLEGYSGNARDSLQHHKNAKFSTRDRDQDSSSADCAKLHHGAWWYTDCYSVNLAGTYFNDWTVSDKGMTWYHLHHSYLSLKQARMMIRPRHVPYN